MKYLIVHIFGRGVGPRLRESRFGNHETDEQSLPQAFFMNTVIEYGHGSTIIFTHLRHWGCPIPRFVLPFFLPRPLFDQIWDLLITHSIVTNMSSSLWGRGYALALDLAQICDNHPARM